MVMEMFFGSICDDAFVFRTLKAGIVTVSSYLCPVHLLASDKHCLFINNIMLLININKCLSAQSP